MQSNGSIRRHGGIVIEDMIITSYAICSRLLVMAGHNCTLFGNTGHLLFSYYGAYGTQVRREVSLLVAPVLLYSYSVDSAWRICQMVRTTVAYVPVHT